MSGIVQNMKPSINASIEGITDPSDEQKSLIRNLVETVNQQDGTSYGWVETDDFLKDGETGTFLARVDGLPAGWMQLFAAHGDAAELTAQVHPDYRRQGFFRQFLIAARNELGRRGAGLSLLLVVDAAGSDGAAMAEGMGGRYRHSEFLMRLSDDASPENQAVSDTAGVALIPAEGKDSQRIAEIFIEGFPDEGDNATDLVREFLESDRRRLYTIGYSGETVGMIGVYDGDYEAYIHGFVVVSEHRGRGIGRSALAAMVKNIREENPERPIELEVETTNAGALGLYESVGFRTITEFRYYLLEAKSDEFLG